MTQSHKMFDRPGWIIPSLFILSLVSASAEISAQTNTLKIFVKDFSGGLANSQQSPSAPILDSNYVQNPLFTLLDTTGVDSVTLYYPNWNPADTLFTRPDGVIVLLPNYSDLFMIFLSDTTDFETFHDEYITLEPLSILYPGLAGELDYTPTDLFSANQPYMFAPGASEFRINATKAWDFTTGNASQVITIIDGGFFPDHEDFAGRIIGGHSYNPLYAYDFEDVPGRLSHGTACAGILGATGDANPSSGSGMAGLNWKAKLYLIRVDFSVSLHVQSVADAIGLSNSLEHDPISCSLGPRYTNDEATDLFGNPIAYRSYEAWVMDRTIVASKGNNNLNTSATMKAPADLSTVIGVGAVNESGVRLFGTNYGARIRVTAPGEKIYRPVEQVSGYDGGFKFTSAATPQVAGTISLIKAANPKLLADEAEAILYLTARDVTETGIGYDIETGYGIIDAGDAVEMAATKVIWRDSATSVNLFLKQDEHTRIFYNNYGYNGGLPTGIFTQVVMYESVHSFSFSFGHDSLYPVVRLRSTIGWSLDDHPDSTREIAWAAFDTTSLNRNGVIAYTGVYLIPDNGSNPPEAVGWWPCKNPPCEEWPDINLQISILVGTLAGDANNNLTVNMADALYIIDLVFDQGPQPPILNDGDANGNCTINIADAIYIINLVFNQGPAPVDANCIDTSLKLTPGFNATDGEFVLTDEVSLLVADKQSGAYPLKLDTKRNIHGIDITLKALGGSQVYVTNRREDMQLWWSQSGDIVRIGLLDTLGQGHVPVGIHDVVDVKGSFEVISVLGVETLADGTIETIKAPFVNGKNASAADGILAVSFDGIEPNPFNPETRLSFSLPHEANVTIEIFNILGQRVTTVTDQRYDVGTHSVIWNSKSATGGGVSSGVYFARMTSGEFVSSKKMMILK